MTTTVANIRSKARLLAGMPNFLRAGAIRCALDELDKEDEIGGVEGTLGMIGSMLPEHPPLVRAWNTFAQELLAWWRE